MHRLDRRRFFTDLLAGIPALRVGAGAASITSLGCAPRAGRTAVVQAGQSPLRGTMVASGEDRFRVDRAIGPSVTTFKVSAGDTGRALFAMEQRNEPARRGGPPLHLHYGVDEFWYVIAGEYLIEVDGQRFRARAGDCVLGPRNLPHRWAFVGETPGQLLITFTPAGRMEEFFGRPRTSTTISNDPELYRQFGMELLGSQLELP